MSSVYENIELISQSHPIASHADVLILPVRPETTRSYEPLLKDLSLSVDPIHTMLNGDVKSFPCKLKSFPTAALNRLIVFTLPDWKGGGSGEDISISSAFQDAFSKALSEPCQKRHVQVALCCLPDCHFPGNRAVRIAIAQIVLFLKCGYSNDFRILIVFDHDGVSGDMHLQMLTEEINRQRELEGACSPHIRTPQDDGGSGHDSIGSHGLTGVSAMKGDITQLNVDAIVNAANAGLKGGGGVDGAIHRAAGPGLLQDCRAIGSCNTGSAVVTLAHNLPSRFVIHAVGPVWRGGGCHEGMLLASCYMTALELAIDRECSSIAFPAISCGVYGFPVQSAVGIAVDCVARFRRLTVCDMRVVFCCFDDAMLDMYQTELQQQLSS